MSPIKKKQKLIFYFFFSITNHDPSHFYMNDKRKYFARKTFIFRLRNFFILIFFFSVISGGLIEVERKKVIRF